MRTAATPFTFLARPLRSTAELRHVAAFTLIELLVVIAIIGVLASIGIPALKGFGSSNAVSAATRQLMDDMSLARQTALNNRSEVLMVFVPPMTQVDSANLKLQLTTNTIEILQLTHLTNAQYSSYALYAKRTMGDQPGAKNGRYLTPWRSLPEGVFIATNEFTVLNDNIWKAVPNLTNRPLHYVSLPFPSQNGVPFPLPTISFNFQGQLSAQGDEYLMLTRGSLVYSTAPGNPPLPIAPEVVETPKNNTRSNNVIRIDWLTGRARAEKLP